MLLRLSIILFTLAISILILHCWRGELWGWKSSSKRLALWTSVVCALLILTILGLVLFEDQSNKQSEYLDLALGMTKAEVVYIKGTPTNVAVADREDGREKMIKTENIEEGLKIEDFNYWSYSGDKEQHIDIDFDKAGSGVIGIGCYSRSRQGCPSILGISTGNSEEDVLRRFGEPDTEEITNGVKTMYYEDSNILVNLKQEKVHFIGVRYNVNLQ